MRSSVRRGPVGSVGWLMPGQSCRNHQPRYSCAEAPAGGRPMALLWVSRGTRTGGRLMVQGLRRSMGVVGVLAVVMVALSATAATELHAAIVKPTYVTSTGGG